MKNKCIRLKIKSLVILFSVSTMMMTILSAASAETKNTAATISCPDMPAGTYKTDQPSDKLNGWMPLAYPYVRNSVTLHSTLIWSHRANDHYTYLVCKNNTHPKKSRILCTYYNDKKPDSVINLAHHGQYKCHSPGKTIDDNCMNCNTNDFDNVSVE